MYSVSSDLIFLDLIASTMYFKALENSIQWSSMTKKIFNSLVVTFIILQLQLGKSECMYWQDYKDYYNNIIALAASYLEGIKNTWKKCTLFIWKNSAKAVQVKGYLKWRIKFSRKKCTDIVIFYCVEVT